MGDDDGGAISVLRPWLPWIAAGLVLGALVPGGQVWWWGLGLPLAALALLWPGVACPLARRWALLLACATLGSALAPPPPDASTPSRLVELRGTVHRAYPGRFDQRFLLTGITLERGVLPPGQRTVFCLRAPLLPIARPGDRVLVAGLWRMETYRGRLRDGFEVSRLEVVRDRGAGPRAAAWTAVERLGSSSDLAAALLLGRGAPDERWTFKRAGLLHVLAVSGLHLGLAIGAIYLLLSGLGVPWRARQVLAIGAAFAYLWFTGGSLPTQRAALMAVAFFGYRLLARRPHRLAAISLAIIALVLWDPAQVRTVSFQLSVAAVLGIATLGLDLVAWRTRHWPLRPWPLDRPVWRGVLWLGRGASDGLAIGIAATLAVMPLLGWHFGEAQPWSPLASVVVAIPLSLALITGLVYLVASSLWLAGPWAGLALVVDGALGLLASGAELMAALPGSLARVGLPPPWLLVLWPALFLPLRDTRDLALRGAALTTMLAWWWG